jgi:hypothetical protein
MAVSGTMYGTMYYEVSLPLRERGLKPESLKPLKDRLDLDSFLPISDLREIVSRIDYYDIRLDSHGIVLVMNSMMDVVMGLCRIENYNSLSLPDSVLTLSALNVYWSDKCNAAFVEFFDCYGELCTVRTDTDSSVLPFPAHEYWLHDVFDGDPALEVPDLVLL